MTIYIIRISRNTQTMRSAFWAFCLCSRALDNNFRFMDGVDLMII